MSSFASGNRICCLRYLAGMKLEKTAIQQTDDDDGASELLLWKGNLSYLYRDFEILRFNVASAQDDGCTDLPGHDLTASIADSETGKMLWEINDGSMRKMCVYSAQQMSVVCECVCVRLWGRVCPNLFIDISDERSICLFSGWKK